VKTPASPSPFARFGVFELDLRSRELRKQGMKIRLQGQPVEILVMLLERPGETVSREELQKKLWPADTFVDFEQGLNNAMKRLRAALDDNAENPHFIETLPRRGYRFIGSVNGAGHEEFTSKAAGEGARPTRMGRHGPWRLFWPTVGLAVVLAVVFLLVYNHQTPPPKITAITQLTSDGREKDLPIGTDGLRVYFSELVDGHWTVVAVPTSGGQAIPIRTPLKDVVFRNISPDRSDLLVAEGGPIAEMPLWRVPILGGSPRRLGSMLAHDANWSPDGKKLVYATAGILYVAESDGTGPRELVRASADPELWAWRPHWSPDGSHIRFSLYHMSKQVAALWEVTADGKDLHQVLPGWQNPPMHNGFSWTSDGRYYLFSAWRGLLGAESFPAPDIWTFRERTGWFRNFNPVPVQLTVGPLHFFGVAPSLDGKTIFAGSSQSRGELMHYDARTREFSPFMGGISAQGVNFSKDGAWMTYVTFPQGELWRCKRDGSERLQLTFPPTIVHDPHWSPDGKRIVYSGFQAGGKWQLYLVSADGGASQRLLPESEAGIDPTWSPDGNSILFGQLPGPDSTGVKTILQIYNLQTQRASVVPGSEGLHSPRWSPDGRYISASYATNNRQVLFDFMTQKWTEQTAMFTGWQSWSRDSKYVYFLAGTPNFDGVFRVAVSDNKLEKIVDLKDFHSAGTFGAWLSLTPDDDPLVLRDTGPPEIYALSWDAP
jgi:Tol biopolymer transport system component/DNA-binding winged helix-turn-helix (wHTH) protein